MDKTYKAIFTCPEYNEREVWYVSSRHEARKMLNRHIFRPGSTNVRARYRKAEYEMQLKPMFVRDGWITIDPR